MTDKAVHNAALAFRQLCRRNEFEIAPISLSASLSISVDGILTNEAKSQSNAASPAKITAAICK